MTPPEGKNLSGRSSIPSRAVLFDFDGTLFDASEAICQSFNAVLRSIGRQNWSREQIIPLIGRPLIEMFAMAVPESTPTQWDEWLATYRATFFPISVSLTRPLPGLHGCIEALRQGGFRLAIVTNRTGHGARHILAGFGLSDSFEVLIGIDEVTRTKPDPEPVHLALARLGVAPEYASLVGDTPEDMQAAVAAGVRAFGVLTGFTDAVQLKRAGAEAVLSDLTGLVELLQQRTPG